MTSLKRHILFWLLYISFLWIYAAVKSNNTADLFTFLCKQIINIGTFYYGVHIFWQTYFNRKKIYAILLFLAGMALYYIIRYCLDYYLLPALGKPIFDPFIIRRFFTDQTFIYCNYTVYSLLYVFVMRTVRSQKKLLSTEKDKFSLESKNLELQKEKLLLQSQNLQLQNEKLKVQYDFLKAQINPHFLYNTLSFFYSKTAATDIQTAEGIALLTDIMRYSLQQGEADGKVELEDEVAHLNSYLRLQQMRFNNTLNIELENDIETENYRILPHVFITLVENAFKHGEVNNPMHPLKISLKETDNKMIFLVKNKIQHNPVINPGTGVGLNNIRNRVKMEYGEDALLENSIADDFFSVSFSVPLDLLKKKTGLPATQNNTRPVSFLNKKIAL